MENTKQKLEMRLKDAMRSGDDVSRRTMRMILTAIKMGEVEKGGQLDESSVLALVQKEIKSRRESIEDANRANRPDLAADTEAEIKVLQEFLPAQLTPEELQRMAKEVITELGATSPADMGKVIKALMPRVQGRAPGDQVSLAVRQMLQNQ